MQRDHKQADASECIDVINVYNVYKKIFVNAFIILSTFISIKITWAKRSKIMTATKIINGQDNST